MFEKIKTLFSKKNSFAGASLILIATLICSNILGLLRNRFLAQKIPQYDLDTYLSAFRIPDLLLNLLILGAISAVFVPVFVDYISKKKEKTAWHIANSMINIVFIVIIVFAALMFFLMPTITNWIVPGFDHFQKLQTIKLARLLLLSPLFFGISYIFNGILNSYKRFLVSSIGPLIYNLSIIIAILFLSDKFGVWGIGLGVIAGAFLHMIIQIPVAIRLGWKWQPILDFKHQEIKQMGKLMIPRIIGLASGQIVLIVFTLLASKWVGNVTYFNFANDIQTFFSVVFGSSFAVAIFPILSENASRGEKEQLAINLRKSFKQILFFILPFIVLIIMLRAEIVRILLGTGFYDWKATIITANALAAFAVGLWATSLIQLFGRVYYVYKDTLKPTIISLVSMAISIAFGIYLSEGIGTFEGMQAVGLAAASTIGSIVNIVLLMVFLKDKKLLWNRNLSYSILKYIVSVALMILIAQATKVVIGKFVNMQTFLGVFVKTISTLTLSLAFYIALTYIWGCREITAFTYIFKRKIKFQPSEAIEEQGRTEG